MIKRYSRKELTDIWSEENKYKIWLDVEVAAAQAMEKLGQIPNGVSSVVRKKAKINVKRIHQIENQVNIYLQSIHRLLQIANIYYLLEYHPHLSHHQKKKNLIKILKITKRKKN